MRRAGRQPIKIAVLLSGVLLLPGCAGTVDKAGGTAEPKVTVLTMVNPLPDREVLPFVEEVRRLSRGRLRIDLASRWHLGRGIGAGATAEAEAIRHVEGGRSDLGVVPARAWDSVGVHSFDALVAPMAIDSMALQRAVLKSRLVGTMLAGTTAVGVTGIGVLPGPLRRPVGISHQLLTSSDFVGSNVGISAGDVASRTMLTLGAAAAVPLAQGQRVDGLDGVESPIGAVTDQQYKQLTLSITANVALWPRPLVVFANPAAMSHLARRDRAVLRRAAASALPTAIRHLTVDEADAVGQLCRRGGITFVDATPADLRGFVQATEPVRAELSQDPTSRTALEAIAAMRSTVTAERPASCRGIGQQPTVDVLGPRSKLDGTYTMTTTRAELVEDGNSDVALENYGQWVFVVDRGRFAYTQENFPACGWGYGTWDLTGDTVHWLITDGGGEAPSGGVNKPGEAFVFGWSVFRDSLTLTPVPGQVSPSNFLLRPWHRVSRTPLPARLSQRCPPPSEALPRR
jgi:TRAP-type C4-dicarboxylate transport system substrate-binding protein